MTPEGRVKAKVKKALEQFGRDCWRFMPVQTGYGAPALDFLLSIRGRFVAIETKAPGKKLTPQQEQTKAAIERAGGIVLVVWDETSLAIAMKILLALEFAPRVDIKPYETPHAAQCLDIALPAEQRMCDAVRTTAPEAWPEIEHEGAEQPAQAADEAAGGDHGASGKSPQRRA